MTAEEMFEAIGWKKTDESKSSILYTKGFRMLDFSKWDEETNIVVSSGHIDMKMLKAINKQCEELGWLDD